jgi:pimeloyl-ACP methyl ester carboxylesterase
MTQPTRLLLVHGAFHGAWCWDRLRPELERLGISHEAVDLPFTSTADDVAAVRRAIDGAGESITVVGHSFGGAVISAAAVEGGKPYGTVSSLIYLTAFMTAPEQHVDFSGAPGMADIELGEVTASIRPEAARSVFYHRCSPDDADWASARLRAMPTSVLAAPPVPLLRRLHRRSDPERVRARADGGERRQHPTDRQRPFPVPVLSEDARRSAG